MRCRAEHIESPGRISGATRSAFEARFCQRTTSRLDEPTTTGLLGLLATDEHGGVVVVVVDHQAPRRGV